MLGNVARTLTEFNQTIVEVAGHTDSVGTDSYNQALSERRANAVAGFLGSRGVMQQRMIGAGESRPVVSSDTSTMPVRLFRQALLRKSCRLMVASPYRYSDTLAEPPRLRRGRICIQLQPVFQQRQMPQLVALQRCHVLFRGGQ